MRSSNSRILRGEEIEGTTFCSPSGSVESEDTVSRQEKENLKALEEFWYTKGEQEGRENGFQEGISEGQKEGYQRGRDEGVRDGVARGDSEGYERGLEEGRAERESEVTQVVEQLTKTIEVIQRERLELLEKIKPELVELAMVAAEKIVRDRLQDADTLQRLIEGLVGQAQSYIKEKAISVVVHPDDFERLGERRDQISSGGELSWVQDSSMRSADVRLETHERLLHYSIDRQLDELQQFALEIGEETDDGTSEGD